MKKNITLGSLWLVFAIAIAWVAVPPPGKVAAQFVSQQTYGGTSGGSANDQTITIPNMSSYLVGVPITFIPGATNTGPVTLNINSLGPIPVRRKSSIGLVALSGQELTAGEMVSMVFDGSNMNITSPLPTYIIGGTVDFRGPTPPRGTLFEDGSCVSQTTYAALYSVIGTVYGNCSPGLFALPDSRGDLFVAADNQGSNGSAGRLNSLSGCSGTVRGAQCGNQLKTLTANEIPVITPSGSVSTTTTLSSPSAAVFWSSGAGLYGVGAASQFSVSSITASSVSSFTGSTWNPGGGQPHSILNPMSVGQRAITY